MNTVHKIPKSKARRIAIQASGLHQKQAFGSSNQGIVNALRQIGYVQIDTISVVERAHHHVIWARVPSYKKESLHHLQATEKAVFEYWSHAAAFLPIEDYRYTLPRKKWFKDNLDPWPKSSSSLKKKVYERIKAQGPLMARDFEGPKTKGQGWWDWKPAKLALERLFLEGEILTTHRKGFQKVYDLPERYLPVDVSTSFPSHVEYARYLINNSIRSFGLATAAEISYLRKGISKTVKTVLNEKVENGDLIQCKLSGNDNLLYYARPSIIESASTRITNRVRLLSPFDNVLIQRKRLKEIFDFDYQIECYVPKAKRKFGYFSLPILYGDQFIGRADCKAERKSSHLLILNLHLEPYLKITDKIIHELGIAFNEFAKFNNCSSIELVHLDPKEYREIIKSSIFSK